MQNNVTDEGKSKKWKWYHGVLFYAGVQAATFGLARLVKSFGGENKPGVGDSLIGNENNNEFYNNLIQPVFAPPDWMFPTVWTINNISCIYGLLRVANMPKETEGRSDFIALQLDSWIQFAAFSAVFFGLKSPINAAALTVSYTALTAASLYVALSKLNDKPTAISLASVSVWLAVAVPTSVAVAVWNDDEFYGTTAAFEAPSQWTKNLN
jgi:tryptophan-rich sensory protein